MLAIQALMIGLLLSVLTFVSPAFASPTDDLTRLADDYWAHELREDPLSATHSGVHEYNHLLPQVAPEDYARRAAKVREFLARLGRIDRKQLPVNEQLNADLLGFILGHHLALSPYKNWRIPVLADSGFHSDMSYIVGATPFRNASDYQSYLARLAALPAYLNQNVANMRLGLAEGFTQPKQILDGVLTSFEALATKDVETHILFQPFLKFPETISQAKQKRLRTKAKKLMAGKVLPAYAETFAFMKGEYATGAVDKVGALYLPEGKAYYQSLVRYYTSLDDSTPEKIHQLGLKEVARIRAEMNELITETGFKGSFAEFLKFLRTDPQFYAQSKQALLERAAWIAKDIDGRLPQFFGRLPRQPYSVEPVPDEIAPNYTTGRYVGAALDASIGGQYWVNTYGLDKRPLYQLTALTLHEAVPGHHLQGALTKEIANVPTFRREFYPHAFGEGWGLYAEKLGVEMGVYRTPYEHFGRLSYEMWRACRLVIDTGLHAKGWTREQAFEYLASNTALSHHNVQTEVDRYISWPGQALAYKMGELTILELRAKAKKQLGDAFDIREFHDAVLAEGGVPLDLLRAQIQRYIERTASK